MSTGQHATNRSARRGYLTAGDGNDCVDVDDVRDEMENGEEDEDKVVLTSSLATATTVVAAPGDEKYVLT